jgi:salicylate synthetase
MLTLSKRTSWVYCEAFLPVLDGQELDALALLRMLLDRQIIARDQFFLYRNVAGETRIVGDPFAVVTVDTEAVSFSCLETGQLCQEAVSVNPFKQVERILWSAPLSPWTAYGYITFDLLHHSFAYGKEKQLESPLLCFLIPKMEIRLTAEGAYVRGVDSQVVKTIADIWEEVKDQERPAAARPTPLIVTTEDRAWYEQAVRTLIAAIRQDAVLDGPLQKVILSRSLEVSGLMDLLGTYALVQKDPSVRSYCFRLGLDAAVGASPEILFQADAAGHIRTHPLAGTRWRGASQEEDVRLKAQLQASRKQQMEHLISVLAVQGELERVCRQETVFIRNMAHVQQYRTVQHLASQVSGQLAPSKTCWDALQAVFPGVTVSGISKAAAISWIDRLESTPRGLYAGAIGWIGQDGSADLAIAIRAIFQRGSRAVFQAGAGIVLDSDPTDEYEETWHKMQTVWPYFVRTDNME